MERGDDVKRPRIMELVIVERVKQGLPLTKDAMNYLINFFDLESLNRFCATSWIMQDFCKENQVWRKKFFKHFSALAPNSSLSIITTEQWFHYWDFLASTRCPNQYRLLVSFLTLFENFAIISLRNNAGDIQFNLDVEFGTIENLEEIFDEPILIEEGIGFLTPMVLSCTAYRKFTDEFEEIFYDNEARKIIATLDQLGWYYGFEDAGSDVEAEDPMTIDIPSHEPKDAVTIIYNFLELGYAPPDFDYRRIVAQIKACATCAAPEPKTVCGNCETVAYCGQKCADKHWEKHCCN